MCETRISLLTEFGLNLPQNSGFMGGKFLERQRVVKHQSPEGFCDWMTEKDLLVELPGTVWINDHLPLASEGPHGGFKQSGYGKDMSAEAVGDYLVTKHIILGAG